jgi:RNA polymerase sigma-70 factor (ECF subfamily)
LPGQEELTRFERAVLPHWKAAYNLARWLVGHEQDAEDVVQEAYLRAFKFFDGFHGEDSRAWLLAIVRNTAYTWLRQNKQIEVATEFDEELHSAEGDETTSESELVRMADYQELREALEALPVAYREVIILHDLEGLAYKEIARVADIPLGTVMSRLARARKRLHHDLVSRVSKESSREL